MSLVIRKKGAFDKYIGDFFQKYALDADKY